MKILLIGRIAPWKGHELFLHAARALPQHDFLIAGSPNPHDEIWAEKLKKNSPKNVKWLGFVDPKTTISAVDAVANCSLAPEPFGRTLIEAAALDKKIIAPDEGGPAEICREIDGELYEITDNFSPKLTWQNSAKNTRELSRRAKNRTKNFITAIKNCEKTQKHKNLKSFELKTIAKKVWDEILR